MPWQGLEEASNGSHAAAVTTSGADTGWESFAKNFYSRWFSLVLPPQCMCLNAWVLESALPETPLFLIRPICKLGLQVSTSGGGSECTPKAMMSVKCPVQSLTHEVLMNVHAAWRSSAWSVALGCLASYPSSDVYKLCDHDENK